ncbi:GyrI-like domain-containing protein [Paenibacillus sp. V4I7]|uniref:GyrI-like domain-containing protein n=1 Tax=Paenibacillus sp. V4I7 TaxID=3042307 RepID=UPI00277EE181|nr:effector binding domain-containing protein [Paenibacillus sp. V4I7]MDQ0899647.1 putative transcriptional regulator YdeE [Paenibacillus sp. V4I7]
MENKTMIKYHCETLRREYQLVGQSLTANFPKGFPDAALQIQSQFAERRHEITNAKDQEILFSPYMCNGIFATYFACLEVDDLTVIPEGMIGFKLPAVNFAKINCTTKTIGEAYSRIFEWMKENGYQQKFLDQSCPIEIYYFEENVEEENVEILIPIKD